MKTEQMSFCIAGGYTTLLYYASCTKPTWRFLQPKLPPFVGVDGVQFALTPTNIKRRS